MTAKYIISNGFVKFWRGHTPARKNTIEDSENDNSTGRCRREHNEDERARDGSEGSQDSQSTNMI